MMDMHEFLKDFHFVNGLWVVLLPALLMVVDFMSGFINAWAKHNIRSDKMRSGLAKKCGELFAILVGELFAFGMQLPPEITAGISIYILFMETISIVENLALLGVPMPTRWKDKLDQMNTYYFSEDKDKNKKDGEGG